MTDGFGPPDFVSPIDGPGIVGKIPEDALVKGMFFDSPRAYAQRIAGRKPGRDKYIAFKDYAVREHAEVLLECAKVAFPHKPVREGLRCLGRDAYTTFVESLAGKVIFSVAGRSWNKALGLVAKAYGVTGNKVSAGLVDRTQDTAIISLDGVWNFVDTYHVGVFEQAMEDFGQRGDVWIRTRGPDAADFKLTWTSREAGGIQRKIPQGSSS